MSSYASSLDDAIRDPNQEVSFKIKPLLAGGETSGAGTTQSGVATAPAAAPAATAPLGFGLNGMSALDPKKQATLKKNPQLAQTPSTVQQDDLYAAQLAQAQHQATTQYLSVLRDIGFTDDQGNFLPGLIESEASRRRSSLMQQQKMATDKVNQDATRGGTFFSGRRATNLANTQDPYARDLASLETDVPRMLTDRYNDIGNLLSGFSLTQDQLLAELAQRRAAQAQAAPSGDTGAPPPGIPPYASGPIQTSSYANLGYANTGNLAAALAHLVGH